VSRFESLKGVLMEWNCRYELGMGNLDFLVVDCWLGVGVGFLDGPACVAYHTVVALLVDRLNLAFKSLLETKRLFSALWF